MKKIDKSGTLISIVISIVLIALLNVFTFSIPFPKQDLVVFYTGYGCLMGVTFLLLVISIATLCIERNSNMKIAGLPAIFVSYLLEVIQLLATIIFYALGAFLLIPVWVVALVESLILGIGVICIALALYFKYRYKQYHSESANTEFMDEFRARLKALSLINEKKVLERELNDLVDTALASDPISNAKTLDSESVLLSLLQELDLSIKEGTVDETRTAIKKTREVLIERNALCKLGK